MEKYSKSLQIRWSDIDQNKHLRHSVYYDFGAFLRIAFLTEHGLSFVKMEEMRIGPIIFREEAIFKKEIKADDKITIDVELTASTPDYGKWSLRHHFWKEDGTLAAVLNLDGAWFDTDKRKLMVPGTIVRQAFEEFPRSQEFSFIIKEK